MISFNIFLIFTLTMGVYGNEEYVPTLIWTSPEFQGRKNTDHLLSEKVKSDLFEAYIMELLGDKKPLIVVFLEEDLGCNEFGSKNKDGGNSFPFLSKLALNSGVDYFQSVESPYKTLAQLRKKGYSWNLLRQGTKFNFNEGDLLLVEFQKIEGGRPETMKKHDQQIEEIHRQLAASGIKWISIYTAKKTNSYGLFSKLNKMSPWHVEEQLSEKITRVLSLYKDESTGFAVLTKGSIQLILPSSTNLVVKNLEDHLVASAKPSQDGMDFVICVSNYTVTFHLNESNGKWIIKEVKLLNGNGDILRLTSRQEDALLGSECYLQLSEFHSEGKPVVKVIVSKYKFIQLEHNEEPCTKPYAFHITIFLILISIVSSVICWHKLLENFDFSRETKKRRVVSAEPLIQFKSNSLGGIRPTFDYIY